MTDSVSEQRLIPGSCDSFHPVSVFHRRHAAESAVFLSRGRFRYSSIFSNGLSRLYGAIWFDCRRRRSGDKTRLEPRACF